MTSKHLSEQQAPAQQQIGRQTIDYAEHRYCHINGVDYCYLEALPNKVESEVSTLDNLSATTQQPTILFLHGYPDNAYSWQAQIRYFSQQGYRVIAPFMRGYMPTVAPDNAYFDRATLANDVAQLIHHLNDGQPVLLVGQDWGAAIAYGVLGAFPELVLRSVLLAVPHPVEINRTLKRSPRHVIRSFHWFLFQLPWLPEWLIRGTRGGFLRFLWRLWSPDFKDQQHVEHIVQTLLQERGVEQTLAYYRGAVQSGYQNPVLKAVHERLNHPIATPTRVLCGQQDMRKEMLPRQVDRFTPEAQYQFQLIENAGHFLHREQPEKVNQLIHEWWQCRA